MNLLGFSFFVFFEIAKFATQGLTTPQPAGVQSNIHVFFRPAETPNRHHGVMFLSHVALKDLPPGWAFCCPRNQSKGAFWKGLTV